MTARTRAPHGFRAASVAALVLASCGGAPDSSTSTSGGPRESSGGTSQGSAGTSQGSAGSSEGSAGSSEGSAGSSEGPAGVAQASGGCPRFAAPEVVGHLASNELDEVSGAAASSYASDVLYVHNDSGESALRFFAIGLDGALRAEFLVDGPRPFDAEELAVGPGPTGPSVYLADIGDNAAREGASARDAITIVRVDEPRPPYEGRVRIHATERFELHYPEGAFDAEAFFVDRDTGELFVLGKVGEGPSPVFRARAPLAHESVLERVGDVLPARSLADAITACSLAPDGHALAVRTYRAAFVFSRGEGESWLEALRREPIRLPRIAEPQGEAIAFVDGHDLVTISEGHGADVQRLHDTCSH